MPIPTGALVNVTYRGTLYNQRVMTTFSYRNGAADGGETEFVQLGHVKTHFQDSAAGSILAKYLACLSEDYNCDDVVVQEIYPTRTAMITGPIDLPGSIASPARVPNVAAVIARKTNLAGRDQISPLHIPGPPLDTNVLGGTWTDAYQIILSTFGTETIVTQQITVTGALLDFFPVIINAPYDAGLSSELTNMTVNPRARVMRRRTVGLGQ